MAVSRIGLCLLLYRPVFPVALRLWEMRKGFDDEVGASDLESGIVFGRKARGSVQKAGEDSGPASAIRVASASRTSGSGGRFRLSSGHCAGRRGGAVPFHRVAASGWPERIAVTWAPVQAKCLAVLDGRCHPNVILHVRL